VSRGRRDRLAHRPDDELVTIIGDSGALDPAIKATAKCVTFCARPESRSEVICEVVGDE
jgi:hypothetical protein